MSYLGVDITPVLYLCSIVCWHWSRNRRCCSGSLLWVPIWFALCVFDDPWDNMLNIHLFKSEKWTFLWPTWNWTWKSPPAAFPTSFFDLSFITPATSSVFHDLAGRKDIHTLCTIYLPTDQVHLSYYEKSAPLFFSLCFISNPVNTLSKLAVFSLSTPSQGTTCWLLFEQDISLLSPSLGWPAPFSLHYT